VIGLDNQQESPRTLDWAAGLICGEGSFGFVLQRKRHNVVKVTPVFAIEMKDAEAIDVLTDILKRHDLPVYRIERGEMHGIRVTGLKRLERYVEVLYPVLTGQKKEAARIIGEFIKSRKAQTYGAQFTPHEVELIRASRANNAGGNRGKLDPALLLLNAPTGRPYAQPQ
jgi:hypothetical protein